MLPRQADEFTCSRCFLVHHRSQLASEVVLVDTVNVQAKSRDFAKRKAVKGFVDGLLDLITETEETKANILDYWGRREYLYLGPDEQIIPQDITWIVRQAQKI